MFHTFIQLYRGVPDQFNSIRHKNGLKQHLIIYINVQDFAFHGFTGYDISLLWILVIHT